MDSKTDLLKSSWSTLLASLAVVALLGLASRANAAVDAEHTVIQAPFSFESTLIGPVGER